MKGRVQIETVSSQVLKGNALGDPHLREVPVYLPPSYPERGRRYPVIYYLTGFTGSGRMTLNVNPWKENLTERLDRLILAGKARECVLVIPDCFTSLGGSQYVNSGAVGRYEDHVCDELIGFFEDKLMVSRRPEGRAVMGKSSGGFGAVTLAMRRPGIFGHMACHSGDMLFEACYGRDIAGVVTVLGRKYGGSPRRWLEQFKRSRRKDLFEHDIVNMMAMAACYAPNPKSPLGFDLPFDLETGELFPKVWARWKENDPVVACRRHASALRGLSTLYFDCGTRDEFYLHLGARRLSRELKALRIKHTYEEHGLGHFDMAERYDRSLALLTSRLRA